MEGYRKLHNKELHNCIKITKCSQSNQIEVDDKGVTYSNRGRDEKCVHRKPERQIPLGRHKHKREYNIKMDLK
jgi:hypothetical protein